MMMKVLMCVWLGVAAQVESFSGPGAPFSTEIAASTSHLAHAGETTCTTTRKGFLTQAGVIMAGVLSVPHAARADITNKLASSAALRNVKSVQKKLSSMELYVSDSDYTSVREAIRVAPFSDVRKSCKTLIKGGEDGPDAQALQDKYTDFMASLEKMDSLAGLAIRGRNIKNEEFYASYKATVDSLGNFVEVAQAAAEIPVQYEGEQS
uniref:Uncharacterized protein n=1 Tax=Entomoneis paludosa TaxID=265537 RepID=A0A7S3DRB6_9STRA|mmetsp:Transcript_29267/g.61235  ORF Transcript_29267/g.61235 Transcript_29267/m.61235 type:complete len:208 (+) Transcript_29267:79-702(+)